MCCRVAKKELASKNLVCNLCSTTSMVYPRCMRLCVLLLALLTEVVLCALFFNVDPEETESLLFWENLVENVWVGIFSALLSIPPTLVVVLAFRVPSRVLLAFERTTSLKQLQEQYSQHRSRLNCSLCTGYSLFALISLVFCTYLLAFGHIVTATLQENWMTSSGASVAVDLVAFEVLPALFFGRVGVLILSCDCKCCLCSLVFLEVYRSFRNVVG